MVESQPTRWAEPFGQAMDAGEVTKLLEVKPFSEFNAEAFPANLPLDGILRNDTRVRTYQKGQFVVREGDYGNSAFLVLSGEVRVILDHLPQDLLGRSSTTHDRQIIS